MNSAAFPSIAYPDTWRIGGRCMVPLTIGHALLLDRIGSPWMVRDVECDAAILWLHIRLCSLPYRRAARAVQSWYTGVWLWAQMFHRESTAVIATDAFTLWWHEQWSSPDFWFDGDRKPQKRGSTILHALIVCMMSDFHISRSEVLEMPVREALWLQAGLAEQSGSIRLRTADEDAVLNRVRGNGTN